MLAALAALGSLTLATAQESKKPGGKTKGPLKEIAVDLGGGVKLEMVLIPAGEFLMGSPDSDKDAHGDEKPRHRVRITKPFYLGKYLVTQGQWQAVMGNNPSYFNFKTPTRPVEQVSWDDCRKFLDKLNAKSPRSQGEASSSCPASAVGIRLPGGEHDALLLRRRRVEVGRVCVARRVPERQELGQSFAPGGREEAERLGVVRYARQLERVVRGLV